MSDHDLPDDPSDVSRVEFCGGRGLSALPLAIFILWAIVQSGLLGIVDTIIELPDAESGLGDRLVRLRVTEFDDCDATGRGELLGVVDEA